MARLQDKVAIVTGGGTGIGRGIALAYAREGAIVVIANRREEKGQGVVNEIEREGGRALFVRTDIRSLPDIDNLVERTVEAYGRIDILVNNAGVATAFAPFLNLPPDMYDLVADTNLRGTFFVTQRVARVMAQQRSGKIVIISSNLADIAQPETCHYMATKGGLKSLTKGLALELSSYGICVNAIAPGEIYVESAREFFDDPANKPRFDAVPLRRFGYPQDVAGAAVFLASSESDYITGTTTVIDGGQSIV
jgi:NAD(P)-dependent dehydrogenase (short-subunit alcohol dehydrogenase family)